ncbi:MAG: hypothetical protein EXX96DRAFT_452029, partial [Benjaminiella poitrasii]
MCLSIYINHQQINAQLTQSLKQAFGKNIILDFDNWLAKKVKYHEPTRDKSLKKMLKKEEGFRVYVLDEFKMS